VRPRTIFTTLVLTGAALLLSAAEAEGGTISLRDLKESPTAYVNSRVTVRCIFHGYDDRSAPLATEFTAGRYQNFSAWEDETPIWRQEAFLESSPVFFARFGSPVLKDLSKLKPYERIDVAGIVRTDYGGEPWVEVLDVRSLGEVYHEDALRAVRASEVLRGRQMFSESLSWIESVKTGGLPDFLRSHLHQERAFSLVASGDLRHGAKEFRRAGKLDSQVATRMDALAARADMLLKEDKPWSLPPSLQVASSAASKTSATSKATPTGKAKPNAATTTGEAATQTMKPRPRKGMAAGKANVAPTKSGAKADSKTTGSDATETTTAGTTTTEDDA